MKKTLKSAISLFVALIMAMPMAYAYAAEPVATVADEPGVADVATITFSSVTPKVNKAVAVMDNGANPTVEYREGRPGWSLFTGQDDGSGGYTNERNATINVDLASGFAFNLDDGSTYIVEVDYYDEKGGVFSLVYDSQEQSDRFHSYVMSVRGAKGETRKSANSWRTASFRIQDGKFANRLDASDFKISANILNNNHPYKFEAPLLPFKDGYVKKFYPNRYARISTYNPVLIGEIRVKKLETVNPFTVKITTAEKGNKFYEDEPITFNVELTNNTSEAYTLETRHVAVEQHEKGVKIDRKGEPVSIGAKETKTLTIVEPESPFGIFDYTVYFTADGVDTRAVTEYSRNKIATIQNPQAGTNVHLEGSDNYPNDYEAIFEAGKNAGYISFRDGIRWADVEISDNEFKLKETWNLALEYYEEYGIDPFVITYAVPKERNFVGTEPIRTEEEYKRYTNYIKWLTKELSKAGVKAVESQNEWNLMFPTGTSEEYTQYIKATREAMHSVNPDVKLIGVDIALFDGALIRRMFEGGALDYMDGMSYHPYDWTKPVEKGNQFANVKTARALMEEFGGGDKELWNTESGWDPTLAHVQNGGMIITDHDKGYYIARALLQNNAGNYFDRIYFYEFVNSGMEVSYGEALYGTLSSPYDDVPYAARPAYTSVCATNWLLGGAQYIENINRTKVDVFTGPYIYRWSRQNTDGLGDQFVGLWTADMRENYAVDLGVDEAYLMDMYGNITTMKSHNGVFNIMLNEEPQYLIGNFTKFEKATPTITPEFLVGSATPQDNLTITVDVPGVSSGTIVPTNAMFQVVENKGVVDGKAEISVLSPDRPFENNTVRFDILDDAGKLIYRANVHVNCVETITLAESHQMADSTNPNRWQMQIDVTNNKNSESINGTIALNAPDEITKYIKHIKIAELGPKQSVTYKMFLPNLTTKEMRDFNAVASINTGEVFELSHKMFFTSVPYATTKPVIDGKASKGEYDNDGWFPIKGEVGKTVELLYGLGVFNGDDDLRGVSTILWDEDNLYFFIEVTDNVFVNNQEAGINIWNGDSIQIGVADSGVSGAGGYSELTVALSTDGPCMYRHQANNVDHPTGVVENVELAIVREGTKTYYEMAIPWEECLNNDLDKVGPGFTPRFAFLINEDDGNGRNSYMEYSQQLGAIGTSKNAGWFSDMTLADK